jgi:hypothetical protein
MKRKHYQAISNMVATRPDLIPAVNDSAPSGSGFDSGTTLNEEKSKENRLVFDTAFHHMDEWGGYDGWTEHQVIVTPSLVFGFTLRITGRDRNGIKDYINDVFSCWLKEESTIAWGVKP